MTGPIRVLVVDDHRMFAEALELLLAGEDGIEAVGAVSTAEDAIELVRASCPDVVLMDVDLPEMDGIQGLRRVRELCPAANVVVITALRQRRLMAEAVEAGACGFVSKSHAADELVAVVHRAAAGEMVLPTGELASTLGHLERAQRDRRRADHLVQQLTPREAEILQAFAEGRSSQEVAERLFLSVHTVNSHTGSILRKLECRSKLEAVLFALRHGLVDLPTEP